MQKCKLDGWEGTFWACLNEPVTLQFHPEPWGWLVLHTVASPVLPRPSYGLCPAPLRCDSHSTPTLPPLATSLLWPHSAHPSCSISLLLIPFMAMTIHPVVRETLYIHSFRLLAASTPVPSDSCSVLPDLCTLPMLFLPFSTCWNAPQPSRLGYLTSSVIPSLILSRQKVLCC